MGIPTHIFKPIQPNQREPLHRGPGTLAIATATVKPAGVSVGRASMPQPGACQTPPAIFSAAVTNPPAHRRQLSSYRSCTGQVIDTPKPAP